MVAVTFLIFYIIITSPNPTLPPAPSSSAQLSTSLTPATPLLQTSSISQLDTIMIFWLFPGINLLLGSIFHRVKIYRV